MRSFVKTKLSRNGKITLSFIEIGKSCLSCEFFTSLICLSMHFAKIKILAKFFESTLYGCYCSMSFGWIPNGGWVLGGNVWTHRGKYHFAICSFINTGMDPP